MHYVYVIYSSQTDDIYYVETTDIKQRLKSHRQGDNEPTVQAADWRLVYFEAYPSSTDAKRREEKLKNNMDQAEVILKNEYRLVLTS